MTSSPLSCRPVLPYLSPSSSYSSSSKSRDVCVILLLLLLLQLLQHLINGHSLPTGCSSSLSSKVSLTMLTIGKVRYNIQVDSMEVNRRWMNDVLVSMKEQERDIYFLSIQTVYTRTGVAHRHRISGENSSVCSENQTSSSCWWWSVGRHETLSGAQTRDTGIT